MAKNTEIKQPHLILCEGEDAKYYLMELLKFFIAQDPVFENYQALNFGGNPDLKNYLNVIRNAEGYDRVKTIFVIRDAEKDAQGATQSIKDAFLRNNFSCASASNVISKEGTPRTGFTLFPSCSDKLENGTLEDLCLRTLSKKQSYDTLLKADSLVKDFCFKRPHKNLLHTYFSLTDKYVTLKIGEAAKAGAFDLMCPEVESLRYFLAQAFCCKDF